MYFENTSVGRTRYLVVFPTSVLVIVVGRLSQPKSRETTINLSDTFYRKRLHDSMRYRVKGTIIWPYVSALCITADLWT